MLNICIVSKGRYKCEVSAEAPNFQTVRGVAELNVVGKFHVNRAAFKDVLGTDRN